MVWPMAPPVGRVAGAAVVVDDYAEIGGEGLDLVVPPGAAAAEARHQHQRRAGAAFLVINLRVANIDPGHA